MRSSFHLRVLSAYNNVCVFKQKEIYISYIKENLKETDISYIQ